MSVGQIQAGRLADGRLHLQHGPIDLLIGSAGGDRAVAVAEAAMTARFATVLDELVGELAQLRRPAADATVVGRIATRMVAATLRHAAGDMATPMIAVAGAVADEIAECGWAAAELDRLVVNNGGDIAIRQHRGTTVVGLVEELTGAALSGRLHIAADSAIGGVATSGSGGRSLSLGIADAVTVLAESAAAADVVATLVANAVDLPGHPAIIRQPANMVRDDTDLGNRLVTVAVGELRADEIEAALDAAAARVDKALSDPQIHAVICSLRGQRRLHRSRPAQGDGVALGDGDHLPLQRANRR